ncbi:hypothetical protein KC19_VG258700 [Ceratodon purpureus]|uniref:Uncharacterized protein n=1 Tax=Ceratodon purpureus TaxID=3225 RepID=A0A8T0HV92_CERPU|nr:hypothetical protein KC19_VG258700 [Ceratodon purpureus]
MTRRCQRQMNLAPFYLNAIKWILNTRRCALRHSFLISLLTMTPQLSLVLHPLSQLPARSLLPQLGRALVNSSQEFVTPEGHCDQETTPLWRTIQALQYHRHLHEQTLDVVVCGAFTGLTTSMIPVELQSCVPLFFFFFFGREIVYYHVFWTVLI